MKYAYIRQEDMVSAFEDQTILTVKIPKDVQMELPPGETVSLSRAYFCSVYFLFCIQWSMG